MKKLVFSRWTRSIMSRTAVFAEPSYTETFRTTSTRCWRTWPIMNSAAGAGRSRSDG